ncbi:CWF19-like protein 2 homolog [Drosophila grimshawi]|uniref:GH12610 n=1 Tax=Drosophila grimshawi TaxID=7222 RepID=B4JK83_DROGR|nr:CWF19-like protein 2 homolog [Drosophila grimshawi]EDV99985.1 GH12610 [Drosophila grimshawi]
MSYIQFESGREKEKAREQLREARTELLKQAKERAEERNKRELQKELRGEKDWMLPAVANKLDKLSKANSSSKAKKTKKKSKAKSDKKKKSSKKKSKKRRHDSSSSSDSESDSDSSSSSCDSDRKQRRRHKKSKKRESSGDEWVESEPVQSESKPAAVQRDSWMTDSDAVMLRTFAKERKDPAKPNEKMQQIDAYDPSKSKHELNPYWKSNGTGLPGFQRPKADDEPEYPDRRLQQQQQAAGSTRNWQKSATVVTVVSNRQHSSSPASSPPAGAAAASDEESDAEQPSCLTDEQINELASKALKAQLKGKLELASELEKQVETARKQRNELLASGKMRPAATKTQLNRDRNRNRNRDRDTNDVLLTRTDASGNVRPLMQSRSGAAQLDPNSLYGGRRRGGEKRANKKKLDTHVDGQRVRYFADDDRYDIKQMFEREKHATAAESNLQYADILSKHKNPNDDLEDIFADKVRRNISEADAAAREVRQAISEHEKLVATLENCERCFDSSCLDKQLLVAMGSKIYLSLPSHVGLQSGHCILTSMQHAAACTLLDEDAWQELNDFRKALTRMFAAQRKDVIFYEIANKLHRRPHLTVHCIPIPESHAEMAPFYFKKAIEESEHEWCINKQLISLKHKSLRAGIPKGLPYLWVNFGMESGFAHVIEDQERFPANFAQEIIGGMLDLNAKSWRKPHKEKNIIAKVKTFANSWKNYDCTEH